MRERICAYCGEEIHGKFLEVALTFRRGREGNMRKVDLHPACFDEVWGKCEFKEGDYDEDCEDGQEVC